MFKKIKKLLIFLTLISLILLFFFEIKEKANSQEYQKLTLPLQISQDCPITNKFIYPSKIEIKENNTISKQIIIQCKTTKLFLIQDLAHVEHTYLKFGDEIITIQKLKTDKLGYNLLTVLAAIDNIFILTEFNGILLSELRGTPPKDELLLLDWKTGIIIRI
ncbi:hypothetical protein [Leptospira brenneri]|uniref:hypothetical protein n=1 Tax=Leptospira brenneri TaxID=2023182 RepID=UPI000C2ABC5C|nr:hypothetical protein [Leptospira brenneri]PJZ43648.1 hypothetical protein CH361_19375 [Leptospira brenneri]